MRKIAELVFKFIGGACTVAPANMFVYDPTAEMITFCMDEDPTVNKTWKKFLKENYNFTLTAENAFLISILHELGHHFTIDLFTEEEWTEQATEEVLKGIDCESEEYRLAYFNLPIERAATAWAITMYNKYPKTMRAWGRRFTCALRHYNKRHKVKTTFLTKL